MPDAQSPAPCSAQTLRPEKAAQHGCVHCCSKCPSQDAPPQAQSLLRGLTVPAVLQPGFKRGAVLLHGALRPGSFPGSRRRLRGKHPRDDAAHGLLQVGKRGCRACSQLTRWGGCCPQQCLGSWPTPYTLNPKQGIGSGEGRGKTEVSWLQSTLGTVMSRKPTSAG